MSNSVIPNPSCNVIYHVCKLIDNMYFNGLSVTTSDKSVSMFSYSQKESK